MTRQAFRSFIGALRRYYGAPARPISRDPFRLILWEQVAYLVPDSQRRTAFAALRAEVGLSPAAVAAASNATLRKVARLGGPIAVTERADRLRKSAELVIARWQGSLRAALKLPLPRARKALAQFAMIGEPGADRILLFCRHARLLPLDSNALRVLKRAGVIHAAKDYRATYHRAQEVLAPLLPGSADALADAYHLLRRHGQERCRASAPRCDGCPVRQACAYGRRPFARA